MSNLRYTLLIYDEDDNSVRHFFENNFDVRYERTCKVNHFKDFGMLKAYVSQTEVFRKMISKPQLDVNETSDVLIDVLSESSQRQDRTGNVKINRNSQAKKYHETMDSDAQIQDQSDLQSSSMNRNDGLFKNREGSVILNEKLVFKLSNDFEEVVHRPLCEVPTTSLEYEEEREKIRLFKLKKIAKEVHFPSRKMTSITLDKEPKKEDPQSSNKVAEKIQDQSYDQRRREVMKMIAEKCRNAERDQNNNTLKRGHEFRNEFHNRKTNVEGGEETISAGIKENGELEELKRRIAFLEKQMVTGKMKGRHPIPEEQEDVQLIEYVQENVVEERDNFAEPYHDNLADNDEFQPDVPLPAENEKRGVEKGEMDRKKKKTLKRGNESRRRYCLRKTKERRTYMEDDEENEGLEEQMVVRGTKNAKPESVVKRAADNSGNKQDTNMLTSKEKREKKLEIKRIRSRKFRETLREKIRLNLLTEKEKQTVARQKEMKRIRSRNAAQRKREMKLVEQNTKVR